MISDSPRKTSLKRRVKRLFTRPLLYVALFFIPRFYCWYMTFVWYTSKVEYFGLEKTIHARKKDGGVVAVLWHETVFFSAYAFRELRGSALASVSDFGEMITRMLKRLQSEIIRGGSSRGKSRKKTQVVKEMILHMNNNQNILYGLTVDGSHGPKYKTKKGAVIIAKETGKPICAVHVTCTPRLRLLTWDRTIIALPFSHIVIFMEGPYYCPENANEEEVEVLREKIDEVLNNTKERAEHYLKTKEYRPPSPSVLPEINYTEAEYRKGPIFLKEGEFLAPSPNQ